jgi:RNA polymerase-associated protein
LGVDLPGGVHRDRLAFERLFLERHQVTDVLQARLPSPGRARSGMPSGALRALFFVPLLQWEPAAMMVLYSGTTCPYSHRCRFVLFEKGMDFEIRDVDLFAKPEDIALMNPYNEVPILVERDLILYESHIINEYIDERFPHPQLMPGDPVARARVRLFLFNFEKELFAHVNLLESRGGVKANDKQMEKARSQIRERLTQLAPIFMKNKYMLGDDFSMLDVAIAPLLWRLDYYGIDLSKNAAPLLKYAERIFSRPAYIEALTPSEKVMRK